MRVAFFLKFKKMIIFVLLLVFVSGTNSLPTENITENVVKDDQNGNERIKHCQAIIDEIYDKIMFAIETGHFPISHSLSKEEKNINYILKKGKNN